MSTATTELRDLCRLLGGLTLGGSSVELLAELRQVGVPGRLAPAFDDGLGDALRSLQRALDETAPEQLAEEYTRLMITNARAGARSPLPVPPWEDCYLGDGEQRVLGARSRSVLEAYAAARLGFEGMKDEPADHIGLELTFVAALLEEELRGERDGTARSGFVAEHLHPFSPALGRALAGASDLSFWQAAGHAIEHLPSVL